jgi:hypothetical protein
MMVKLTPDFLSKALQHALCIDVQKGSVIEGTAVILACCYTSGRLVLLKCDILLLECCHHFSAV